MAERRIRNRDLVRLVSVAYQFDLPEHLWLSELADCFAHVVGKGGGAYCFRYEVQGRSARVASGIQHSKDQGGFASVFKKWGAGVCDFGATHFLKKVHPELVERTMLQPSGPGLLLQWGKKVAEAEAHPEWIPHVPAIADLLNMGDSWGVHVPNERGGGLSLGCSERKHPPSHYRAMRDVMPLLQAAQRLRLHRAEELSSVEAIFEPGGKAQHAVGAARDADSLKALSHQAANIERGRIQREQQDWAGESIWPGIVQGRWSLVERIERDGKRLIVAHANGRGGLDPRRLSERENEVARLVAQGMMDKEVALELGLAQSVVAENLRQALEKLGLNSRLELILDYQRAPYGLAHCVGALSPQEPVVAVEVDSSINFPQGLSQAEQDVARLVLCGKSNREIAQLRGSRPRTVANQVQAIFHKCGVVSRAELASLLFGHHSGLAASAE